MTAAEDAEKRIAEGWRPAKFEERAWLRGGETQTEGPDDDTVAETFDEIEPMTEGEEQYFIGRIHNVDARSDGTIDPVVVEDAVELPEPDTEPTTGAPDG